MMLKQKLKIATEKAETFLMMSKKLIKQVIMKKQNINLKKMQNNKQIKDDMKTKINIILASNDSHTLLIP